MVSHLKYPRYRCRCRHRYACYPRCNRSSPHRCTGLLRGHLHRLFLLEGGLQKKFGSVTSRKTPGAAYHFLGKMRQTEQNSCKCAATPPEAESKVGTHVAEARRLVDRDRAPKARMQDGMASRLQQTLWSNSGCGEPLLAPMTWA